MIGLASIASNPMAQRALIVAIIVAIFFLWLAGHDDAVRKLERARSERKARLQQDKIRTENNAKLEKAERTRADFRADDADDDYRLSDAAIERLTRRANAGE